MNNIRVRFSPSPTGHLHIGGVRTALFNWLWARKNNSKLILRVEDTDQKRSTPESKAVIFRDLKWLGLNWDEGEGVGGSFGPYEQMQRLDIYKYYADKLISKGHAYRCYCTEKELDAHRNSLAEQRAAGNKGAFFKYPGTCRDRKDNPDKPFVVRFRAPTNGVVEYTDKIFGKMVVPNKENQDFVLMRSDGIPLYNFGAAIDDMTMGITLVARARDHQINTPPQILIYQALEAQHPEFCHMPLMMSATGEKLSKRHGAVSVSEYRNQGYTPAAILNYLARFGWGYGNQEIFTIGQLIDAFSWEGCGKNDGRFDAKKFASIQYEHLKTPSLVSDKEYAAHLFTHIEKLGITTTIDHLTSLIPLTRTRSKTLVEAANELLPILHKNIAIDPIAKEKFITADTIPDLHDYALLLEAIPQQNWNAQTIREYTTTHLLGRNKELKTISQPIRVCLTGRTNSPDLYDVMVALGKEATIERIMKQATL
jgi:glutamyl-tRNA synthetase